MKEKERLSEIVLASILSYLFEHHRIGFLLV